MKLFDRFSKKRSSQSSQTLETSQTSKESHEKAPNSNRNPERDTFGLLLFAGVISAEVVAEAAGNVFGAGVVRSIDRSSPVAPALLLDLDHVEFWCSCMPMPQPKEVCDFTQIQGGLFSEQEREEILNHKSFLVLSQQGGSGTLEDKRRVCCLFTRLAGELMKREDAAGVYINGAGLMISRQVYLKYAAVLEQNLKDPEYFPAPLWIGIVHAYSKETPVITTMGLHQFGFPELCFSNPVSQWPEIHQRLYLMSIFQITGKELYKNMDTIEFTKGNLSVFKEQEGVLYIIGDN